MLHKAEHRAPEPHTVSPHLLPPLLLIYAAIYPMMAETKVSEVQYVDNKGAFDEKLAPVQTNASYDEERLKQPAERPDYSGAAEKTDPVEIKLVKKLDWYIMPM